MSQTSIAARSAISFAADEDGDPLEWRLDGTEPHMFVTAAAGSGASTTAQRVVTEAARCGWDARFCTPVPPAAGELQMPGVTVAAGVQETARLIGGTWADMHERYARMEADPAAGGQFRRIVLAVEFFDLLEVLLTKERRNEGHQASHPALCQLGQLITMSRAAMISVLLTGHPVLAAAALGAEALGQCGTRVALGLPDQDVAQCLFGDASACAGLTARAPGYGVVRTPARGPVRATILRPAE